MLQKIIQQGVTTFISLQVGCHPLRHEYISLHACCDLCHVHHAFPILICTAAAICCPEVEIRGG
jgi:hypothetical protein